MRSTCAVCCRPSRSWIGIRSSSPMFSAKGAETLIPKRVRVRHVSASPWARLGWDLQRQVRRDRPDLLHVQYTAPLGRTVPVVVTVHDVSFAEHPEYFPL